MAESEELSKNLMLSKLVESGFSDAKQKLDKQSLVLAKRILDSESKLETSENEIEINKFDRDSSADRQALLKTLILTDKISEVLARNVARQKQIHATERLEGFDLSLSAPSKKAIEEITQNGECEASIQNLGLAADSTKFLNFNGKLFLLNGGTLDLTVSSNLEMLKQLSSDDLEKIIEKYPEIIKKFGCETLLNATFRVNLLKAIAGIVFSELKTSDVVTVNRKLGEPLSFKRKFISSYESYMVGLRNLFKVKIRKYLLETKPEYAQEIDKLPCNIHSPLLPDDLYEPEVQKQEESQKEKSVEAEIDEFLRSLAEDND